MRLSSSWPRRLRRVQTAGSTSAGGSSGQTTSDAGSPAVRRGEGDHGAVLAHGAAFDAASWEKRAVAIADQGAGVIAIENIDPDAIRAAVEQLQGEGVADVAHVGASAGADAVLDLASQEPWPADQLIRLAPNAIVEGLGEEPKVVVDSVDEAVAQVSTDLPESSAGGENLVVILPGSAHAQIIFYTDQAPPVLEAMLQRLELFASPRVRRFSVHGAMR